MKYTTDKFNSSDKADLCKIYLSANGYQVDSKYWFPIIGTYSEGKFISYIISHWKSSYEKGIPDTFNLDEYTKIIFFFDGLPPTSFINWKDRTIRNHEKLEIVNIDLNQVISDIKSNETLDKKFNKAIWKRRLYGFLRPFGLINLLVLMIYLITLFESGKPQSITLRTKITNVESAISNVKSIEKDLSVIEQNLQSQLIQAERIEKEYEQIQHLKKLTEEEIEAFRTVNKIDEKRTNWFELSISFVLGILASIAGYYVIEMIKYVKNKS